MDCEQKDNCLNYSGECTNDDFCLCEDFVQMTEEQILRNTLHETIRKLTEFDHRDSIQENERLVAHVDTLYHEIDCLKKQIPNVDQLRKECLQEARKEVFGNLLPGKKAFVKSLMAEQIACTYCNGSGTITVNHADKSDIKECTKCYGRKNENKYTPIVEQKTVRRVEVWIVDGGWNKISTNGMVYFNNDEFNYELKSVFETEEECQAYIDNGGK